MKRSNDDTPQIPAKTPRKLSFKDSLQVSCRIRPLSGPGESSCVKLHSSTTLSMAAEAKGGRECNYTFRHVFSSYSLQQEVFEQVAKPLLEDVLRGKNGLIFTYGVTGSGKTYTLTGDQKNPGIMPRCIDTLFNTIGDLQAQKYLIKPDRMNGFEVQTEIEAMDQRFFEVKGTKKKLMKKIGDEKPFYINDGTKLNCFDENCRYAVFITYTEIYNNCAYDLLDESTGKTLQSKIIREDCQKNMYVNNVVEVEVKSATEAFHLFYLGQKRKRMAYTIINAESSRSHSIFNIRVVQLPQSVQNEIGQPMVPDRNIFKVAQLSLVDLAGSERCSRTQNTGVRLKEASSINNSLMSLRSCLEILRDNQLTGSNRLVPYRDSRLTLLFKNFFEGDGQVRMVVCLNPSVQDYEENLQVLKFAEATQEVKIIRSEVKLTPYSSRKTPKIDSKLKRTPHPKVKRNLLALSSIPTFKLDFENPSENELQIEKLLKALRSRKQMRTTEKLQQKEEHFRKRLVHASQDGILSKAEVSNVKGMLKRQKKTNSNIEAKLVTLEGFNDQLAAKNQDLEQVIRTLQMTIEEKNLRMNQNLFETERNKQKLAVQTAKRNQELEVKLLKQRQHHEAELKFKDLKLQKVKAFLDSDSLTAPQKNDLPQTPRRAAQRRTSQRRSRSTGDVWLEHNAVKPVSLGTVFQPTMKKRKSVTQLNKAKDITNPKQSKYCLIAQDLQDGDVETKLYKGDIVPTCGGGAQVIFNEVERLRQESPAGSPAVN